jgi:hypothetical protein
MNWENIKQSYYYKEPVEYILAPAIFNLEEYDNLYRNQNDLSHQIWQDFDIRYKIGFEFFKDLREFNKDKEVICLWFFKDRDDRKTGNDIDLEGKIIKYKPNTFLITRSKNIKIIERKVPLPYRPVLQLDLSIKEYNKIIKMVKQLIRDLP